MSALPDYYDDEADRVRAKAHEESATEPPLSFTQEPLMKHGAVEQTYAQGKRAYPRQLHPMHSTAAEAGWLYEQVRTHRRTMEQQAEAICQRPLLERLTRTVEMDVTDRDAP